MLAVTQVLFDKKRCNAIPRDVLVCYKYCKYKHMCQVLELQQKYATIPVYNRYLS